MSLRISMLCLMFILVSFAPMKASAEEAAPSPIQAEVARLQILFGTDQDQAVKRLLALKEHLPASATQSDRRKILGALVEMCLNKHDHAQARKFNQELAEFGSAYHDDWARTFAFGEGALLDLSDGKTIDAVLNIEQALNIAQQTGDKKLIGSTNDIAGHIYGDLGDFPLALQHALIALSMLEGHEQRDEMRRAAAMNNIGTLYETMKNPDLALEYNEKAREIAERIDAQYILLSLALTRGAAYSQLEKFADAKISFTDALTIARKISDRSGEAASLGGLSNIAFKQNLFGECIKLAEEAEGLAKQLKDEDLLTDIGKNVGFCHIGMGAVQRGEEEVNSVIDFLHNANEDPAVADVLGEMALAYEKGGLYKEALKAMQQQRDLKDSLLRKNHDRTLAEMQAKFDAAERQKQMEKLEQENRFQKIEIENKNLQRIVGLAALIIVISIAYALVRKKEILRRKAHLENKNKSKFVAEAAHDLRQPMQAISNLLEAMKQAASKDDMSKCKELIGTAQIATQAMRTSFNSVLELSRLEYGLVSAEYSSFHLDELIDELIVSLQPLADERGVIIRTKFRRKESPAVKSDRVLLGRVISNLLSNAIKYSDPAKGTHAAVSVSVAALADSYHVSIADNGLGIPDSERGNIFRPFFQLHNPERNRDIGLGLGLSIVNSIMHLLAGHRLSMRSKVGSGTRFSVYVPKAASKESSYIKNLAFDADAIVDVSGLFILYVEDDALVRSTTESLLREFGILCETSKSVGEFIAKLPKIERMPDLILTDNGLPDNFLAIDVINAATKEFDSNIPTIVLTGESQSLDSLKLLESVTIMRKPVSAAELIKTIQILCAPPARDVEKPVQGITGQ